MAPSLENLRVKVSGYCLYIITHAFMTIPDPLGIVSICCISNLT